MTVMKNLRSLLFMPGNNPGMLVSADNLGADVIIYDLEDAVALAEKDAARDLVANALRTMTYENSFVTVRMNPTDSPYWEDDLNAILPLHPDGLVIPKATLESVRVIENYVDEFYGRMGSLHDLRFLLLVESALGVTQLDELAEFSEKTDALLLGGEDYSVSMGVARTRESKELEYARFRLATAAHAHGLEAIDTPYTDIDDQEGLIKDTEFIRSIGMTGRLIINPRQIRDVHEILSPTQDEVENALAILDEAKIAEEEGRGVFSFKGKMVDKPVIDRAENLVAAARNWGLLS